MGGVDPDVVEAAALAHDLGHPPFGHIAERVLDKLVRDAGNSDGFEGNPQSFRIVTRLALRHQDFPGLNLTRATLNAILKYPWLRGTGGGLRELKWGAYSSESEEFEWARELGPTDAKSPEAELMDWADDIAYSVHDLDDFYRAGLIPLDRLLTNADERDRFLEKALDQWASAPQYYGSPNYNDMKTVFGGLFDSMQVARQSLTRPYSGVREQRASLRSMTASLIRRYITDAISLSQSEGAGQRCVTITPEYLTEVQLLKQLTWEYVINAPGLTTQQYGQRKLIEDLFEILTDAASESELGVFPPRFRELIESALSSSGTGTSSREVSRLIADYISGMTEREAIELHQRLTGASLGSVLDPFSP